jgi:hypothetical protein
LKPSPTSAYGARRGTAWRAPTTTEEAEIEDAII